MNVILIILVVLMILFLILMNKLGLEIDHCIKLITYLQEELSEVEDRQTRLDNNVDYIRYLIKKHYNITIGQKEIRYKDKAINDSDYSE